MTNTIKSLQIYFFWLAWSTIIGGMLISGPILAPLAFTTMPLTVSPEIAQYAYSYAGTLFTLFFIQYFPIVAGAFLLITILEQFYIRKYWHQHRIIVILCEIILLSGNVIWLWLALKLVPEMESMVLNTKTWNEISVREAFSSLHVQSQTLAKIGLGLTLVLPWLTHISGMGLVATSK
ncbi:MAG TPA: hypothetical protein EYN97_06460 [Candidatus Lambdaproteobacteria bacterium]|nr:hypothetical protein [Candidatus Lambdaproteobacteria bacterium]